jgi:hypothetical protein
VTDIVLEEGLLTPEQVERLLAPDSMTAPSRAMRGHEDSRGLRLGA